MNIRADAIIAMPSAAAMLISKQRWVEEIAAIAVSASLRALQKESTRLSALPIAIVLDLLWR